MRYALVMLVLSLILVGVGALMSLSYVIDYLMVYDLAINGGGACLDEKGEEFLCVCSKNGCTAFSEVEREYVYRFVLSGGAIAVGAGLLVLSLRAIFKTSPKPKNLH